MAGTLDYVDRIFNIGCIQEYTAQVESGFSHISLMMPFDEQKDPKPSCDHWARQLV